MFLFYVHTGHDHDDHDSDADPQHSEKGDTGKKGKFKIILHIF